MKSILAALALFLVLLAAGCFGKGRGDINDQSGVFERHETSKPERKGP